MKREFPQTPFSQGSTSVGGNGGTSTKKSFGGSTSHRRQTDTQDNKKLKDLIHEYKRENEKFSNKVVEMQTKIISLTEEKKQKKIHKQIIPQIPQTNFRSYRQECKNPELDRSFSEDKFSGKPIGNLLTPNSKSNYIISMAATSV
jgi:hypothetical protein